MREAYLALEEVRTDIDVVLLAARYNPLDQSGLDDLLPAAAARGASVVIGGVFNSGIPAGLILRSAGLAEGRTYGAEEDGAVVGFASWAETDGTTELEDLFADPGYMRRGIATALVHRIAEILPARGVERLEVTANPDALGFYRAAGFTDCGVAETEFGSVLEVGATLTGGEAVGQ